MLLFVIPADMRRFYIIIDLLNLLRSRVRRLYHIYTDDYHDNPVKLRWPRKLPIFVVTLTFDVISEVLVVVEGGGTHLLAAYVVSVCHVGQDSLDQSYATLTLQIECRLTPFAPCTNAD